MENTYQNAAQAKPVAQLRTNRSMIKVLLLSLITLGIYSLVVWAHISEETNSVCSRYDGKKTMNFWLVFFLIGPITAGIGTIVWIHKLCSRIGSELERRRIDFSFGAGTFWGWGVLGSLIIVGPFVFLYKMFKAMNLMNEDYNAKG